MAQQSDQRDREIEALRERLSRLSQASLRINESLDFDQVLQGVLDSARSLTSARYGVMTLLDDGGMVQHFLSSGMNAQEAERLWLTPDRWRLFEALTNVSEPLRLPDLAEYVHALGFTDFTIPLPVMCSGSWRRPCSTGATGWATCSWATGKTVRSSVCRTRRRW